MTTFGISRVKDEADVIAGTVAHMADECDYLLVVDNASTDGTREILAELADTHPLKVLDDPDVGYYQSAKMSQLAETAAGMGATWIVPFDADELWVAHEGRIADVLDRLPLGSGHAGNPRVGWAEAKVYDHRPTAVDPEGVDPFRTIIWRTPDPLPLPKVAFRWEAWEDQKPVIHQGNHGVDLPNPRSEAGHQATLEVRHFPYRSAEQFIRKARNGAAAYRATDLPPEVGAHWRQYGDLLDRFGEETVVTEVFRRYFWSFAPTESGLILDAAPYCRWRPS